MYVVFCGNQRFFSFVYVPNAQSFGQKIFASTFMSSNTSNNKLQAYEDTQYAQDHFKSLGRGCEGVKFRT